MNDNNAVDYKDHVIRVGCYDLNPREECTNLGTMICFHNRYKLGDKHTYDHTDYSGWDEMYNALSEEYDALVVPLYMHDHSFISLSLSPFSCPWDSGQLGFICVSKRRIRDWFGVSRVTKKVLNRATSCIMDEVREYEAFINGCHWKFEINTGREIIFESHSYYSSMSSAVCAAMSYINDRVIALQRPDESPR
ncbi:MAG TPA: hypothetical protein ENG14_05110 [Thermodesulforhabdus norvegica]|uniref:Uncharacterized protein n=1 Tax=Thermodesulforhabdus norvegica TaxID=39841 RepID=A0A7C0WU36_9BACT|nr:hypothetical protein [Thermodesulforhabdus norvegica]